MQGKNPNHHLKFYPLLIALILLITLYPFLSIFSNGQQLINLALAIVAIASVYAASYHKPYFFVGLGLGIPFILLTITHIFSSNTTLYLITLINGAIFYLYTTLILIRFTLKQTRITSQIISAGVCVYFLFGLLWTELYIIAGILIPGSFATALNLSWGTYVYYSFMTLTTIGYGDIVPATLTTQALSILEGITGMLYLTIFMARLVGLYIVQNTRKKEKRK